MNIKYIKNIKIIKKILTKLLKTSNELIGFSPTFNLYNFGYKFFIFSKSVPDNWICLISN